MINSRQPELTVKFTEKPELPLEGKKATILLSTEHGLKISAELIRKNAAKQLKKIDNYDDWVGAISGKIDGISDGTIFVTGAGLQVFEKKAKVPKEGKGNEEIAK